MKNRDLIATVESRSDLDHWSNSISEFLESWHRETRKQWNKNVEIAICEFAIQSQPLNQDQIWTVDPTPYRSFANRDMERQENNATRMSKLRYAKSRFNHSGWIKIRYGPLIQLHIGVSRIVTWRDKKTMQQECRNHDMRNRDSIVAVESRSDLDRWSKSISGFRGSSVGDVKEY